jgi:superfamily II DNA or RNA helicase
MALPLTGVAVLPYVIDNRRHVLANVLRDLLSRHRGLSLDVASAYFTVGGFGLLREGLQGLGSFRLLLGAEPTRGEQIGLRPERARTKRLLRVDLEDLPFDEATLRLVEDLIAYLRRQSVQVRLYDRGFLHAKAWIFYQDRPARAELFDRFRPILAVVGSSNFTGPGLTSNRELNLAHKVFLDAAEVEDPEAAQTVSWVTGGRPEERGTAEGRQLVKSEVGARAILDLEEWYEAEWAEAQDFKQDLIDLLDASKFGEKEYTPFEVYLKALYEYFKDDLAAGALPEAIRSAVELSEFQEDAVKKARKILLRHHGVMVADSVGLGKTWIGKKLLEDYAYHQRMKAVVICPASLRENWERELASATIAAQVLSQEELGREGFDADRWGDADVVLIDESHNFRNPNAQRYGNLERILKARGRRGRQNGRKKVILLTATPINNDLLDLYHQLSLITIGDKSHFIGSGIGDLYRYFLQARRDSRMAGALGLFNLLEEVVIRRTRPFIRQAYPEATIRGRRIHFPERRLRTVRYDLEATYGGIYDQVVSGIESLRLAPYNLEEYKKASAKKDEFEAGREEALVGIFKSRYLKRFESSIEAFRISVRRALEFLKTFESFILDGRLLKSSDFHKALRYLAREDEEDDATPSSLADDLDASEEARRVLEAMESVDPALYELRRLHAAVQHDVEVLTEIWQSVREIGPEQDAKLARLKDLLRGDLRGKKVLLFTYYRDTARYLYRHLGHPEEPEAVRFRKELGSAMVRRMDSGADPKERLRLVQGFAPKANDKPEWMGTEREIDILISTDVLSEGHNLQDCGCLVNYDLHWNPTRMVQRAGRIDRIGSEFDTLWLYNMFPDEGLERLLRLVESLNEKIAGIDRAGFHDASILGEIVHPRNFNTLRRIRDEDGSVIQEEEQFAELAGSEVLSQQLRAFLEAGGSDLLEELPDGIHSGLARVGAKGVFFYFRAGVEASSQHFWRYVDLREDRILDNRHLIASYIACQKDTPRVIDPMLWSRIFELQERVIEDILRSVREQVSLEVAPRSVDPVQQSVSTAIQGYLNHPEVDRARAVEAIRYLRDPMVGVEVKELRAAFRLFQKKADIQSLLAAVESLREKSGEAVDLEPTSEVERVRSITREDLRLICFDLVTGG